MGKKRGKISLREIIVDGERWRWAVKKSEGSYSEYTPGFPVLSVVLQGPDGYRREYQSESVTLESAITPSAVAAFIRTLRAV